jgi:hypothetical protein
LGDQYIQFAVTVEVSDCVDCAQPGGQQGKRAIAIAGVPMPEVPVDVFGACKVPSPLPRKATSCPEALTTMSVSGRR